MADATDWRRTWQIVAGTFSPASANSGREDLLFYGRDGRGAFRHSSGTGHIDSFEDGIYSSWRRTWSVIPGKFGPGSLTDLLLYDSFATAP